MGPNVFHEKCTTDGTKFLHVHEYSNGHKVPMYDIYTSSAFNQIIGHVKFANADYGNVYYRGVTGLYDNVLPSLMRKRRDGSASDLNAVLSNIRNNIYFSDSLKLLPMLEDKRINKKKNNEIRRINNYRIEGLLQHYAGCTRFLDVVDNHWVALWMSLHNFRSHGKGKQFVITQRRSLSSLDIYETLSNSGTFEDNIYAYVLLIAMPYINEYPKSGVYESDEFVEVDLRKTLPSMYLRPHAQHALVIRRRDNNNRYNEAAYYDMSNQVTAILRVRIDRVAEWLGNGALLTQENLFPSPSVDHGYNNLLLNSELFKEPFNIKLYF